MAVVLICLLSATGCGLPGEGGTGKSPGGFALTPPKGVLTPSAASVAFGNVTTGTSTAQLVTLTDTGTANVAISALSTTGSGFSASGGSNVTLTPNHSVTVSVNFDPTATGTAQGTLSVSSSASATPLQIGLSGSGVTQRTYTVTLNWQPSASQVIGYIVYRGIAAQAGALSPLISVVDPSTSFTDSGLAGGQTYLYAVASVDSANNQSAQSAPISVTIP